MPKLINFLIKSSYWAQRKNSVKDEKRGEGGWNWGDSLNNVTEMGSSTLNKGLGTVWRRGTHLVSFCISKNFLLDLKFIERDERYGMPLWLGLSLSLPLMFYVIYCFYFLETTTQACPYLLALPCPQHFQTRFSSPIFSFSNFLSLKPPFSFALTELFKHFDTHINYFL